MNIHNVSYSFTKSQSPFLKDITTSIQTGKVTTIVGPNGSGKSTLLELLAANRTSSKGSILLDGKEVSSYSAKVLGQKLAVVYQQQTAPADLTVEKLIRYGRQPHRSLLGGWTEDDENAVQSALMATSLHTKRDAKMFYLSGGERQRAWIAMALAQKTKLLFLDEPTTFLDLYHQYEVLELLSQLNRDFQLTIIMVLHDLNQALQYSDRLIVMNDGKIEAEGEPRSILTTERIEKVYGLRMIMHEHEDTGSVLLPLGISDRKGVGR